MLFIPSHCVLFHNKAHGHQHTKLLASNPSHHHTGSDEWGAVLPTWVQHMTTTLQQESTSSAHTLLVFQTLTRHAALFYPFREQFQQQLVGYCQRLGFSSTATAENRRTALDMAALVLRWETMRRAKHPEVPLPAAAQPAPPPASRKRVREGEEAEGGGEPPAKAIKTEEDQTAGQAGRWILVSCVCLHSCGVPLDFCGCTQSFLHLLVLHTLHHHTWH